MSRFKYHVQDQLSSNVAPLSAAIGLALSATTLQAATITVTTLNDGSVSGHCTLRDALISANGDVATAGCDAGVGADDIVFQTGLTGTLNLTDGYLLIATPVTIIGPGPSQLTISGDGSDRLIVIDSTPATNISGLRLQNGYINEVFGGAALLAVSSTASLSNCEIANNTSGPAAYGGAITLSSSMLTLDQCTISGNSVIGSIPIRGASYAFGGGLLAVQSQVAITNSSFENNASDRYGGGLALFDSTATISGSSFTGNDALIGGGMSLGSGSQLDMDDSYISGNTAYAGGGMTIGSLSSASVLTTEIYSNDAVYAGGGAQVGVGYSSPTPLPEPSGSETAFGGPDFGLVGQGLLLLQDSYVALNSTYGTGGGLIAKYESDVVIQSVEMVYNQATEPEMPLGTHWGERGGTLPSEPRGGGLASIDSAYIEGLGVTLNTNVAELGGGGFANAYGEIYLDSSVVSGNEARIGGGLLAGADDPPSMPLERTGPRGGPTYDGVVEVYESLIDGNAALVGGGVASAYGGVAAIKYSTISNNVGTSSGGGAVNYEGGLFVGTSLLENNQAYIGGGVDSQGADTLTLIAGSTIRSNTAGYGGGLSLRSQTDRVKYSTVSDNNATFYGGVLLLGPPMSDSGILNSTITGNTANEIGGIVAAGATLNFVTVSHNTSTEAPLPRIGMLDRGGVAENPGGALLAGDVEASNSIFSDNISPGGTLDLSLVSPGTLTIDYSLIETPGAGVGAGTGNLISLDPQLGILAANGGPTATRALDPLSPAVDVADPSTTVAADQRGDPYPRVFNGRADMGAFEFFIDSIFSDRFEQP